MPSILVTGANRGLGLEFTKQYAAAGYRVFATARAPEAASELQALAKAQRDVHVLPLIANDARSVAALAKTLQGEPLDIVVNNAGVMGPQRQELGNIDYAGMVETFQTNTIGPLMIVEALLENVAKSQRKLLAAVTSGMASISDTGGGSYAYRASKAALNMTFRNLSQDLKRRDIIAIVINPGWVQTDMGGSGAPETPSASIAGMRKVFDSVTLADTGKFYDYRGHTWEW